MGVSLKVLVNGIGVSDSGGVVVLEKLIGECLELRVEHEFIFVLTDGEFMQALVEKYQPYDNFEFKLLSFKNQLKRLYFENFVFQNIISHNNIDLTYNFTGTMQFFSKCPQLIKIQNLLFFSKKLDNRYKEKAKFILWIRQVLLKGLVFRFMLSRSKFIEIQSQHVGSCISDYINTKDKKIFIKSDIKIDASSFKEPRRYDFTKKIKFLYIVGPHFDYMHKNFIDFTTAMVDLVKLGVNFEINITLSEAQVAQSNLWNSSLDGKTNFHGYITDPEKKQDLFCDNTVLISTSIIETIGLHVVEAVKSGVITITPNENYADEVYGKDRLSYELFYSGGLAKTITDLINKEHAISNIIISQQKYLRENEASKFNNIMDVFKEVMCV